MPESFIKISQKTRRRAKTEEWLQRSNLYLHDPFFIIWVRIFSGFPAALKTDVMKYLLYFLSFLAF